MMMMVMVLLATPAQSACRQRRGRAALGLASVVVDKVRVSSAVNVELPACRQGHVIQSCFDARVNPCCLLGEAAVCVCVWWC